jgi:hypothetical protein
LGEEPLLFKLYLVFASTHQHTKNFLLVNFFYNSVRGRSLKVYLKVKESPIIRNGVARIHTKVLNKLGLTPGKNGAISCGNGSILVHIYADTLIEENMISLRPGDRKKLGVKSGENVSLSPYSSIKNKLNDIL